MFDQLQELHGFASEVGVASFDGEAWTTYTVEDGLLSDKVTCVIQGPDGAMWIATSKGLSRYLPTE